MTQRTIEDGPIAEHNYTKLFSLAPAPIAIYKGRELRHVFVNTAYSAIFNHRHILGKTVREAFPELEGQPYFEIMEKVFDTGNPYYGNETPALLDMNNDGNLSTRFYNLVYTPFRNNDNIIEGVMVFGHDVTDLVEARNKEKENNNLDLSQQKLFTAELSRKVEERTRALKELNERLELSNQDLEQFAYIASHDLQEPLRKILLFNNLVLDQPNLTDEAKKYSEKIKTAVIRLRGLIRDLLEYSQLSQKTLNFEETDLNTILKNVLTDYELLISQKEAKVHADVLPCIEAVPVQINQLFFNLIGNALKFTRRSTLPVIHISAHLLSDIPLKNFPQLQSGKDYYEITIRDNGIGFNQEYADKIFTIFQRLNEKSMFGGYGIGLALCRKIVENHSGFIYAKGHAKEGASFSFVLPCTQS
jgi:PAS domain S-box-containing protein